MPSPCMAGKEGPALVAALADIQPVTSMQALAKGIASASRVSNAMADNNWALLTKVWSGDHPDGQRIKQSVAAALSADELVTELAAAVKRAQAEATRLLTAPPGPREQPETRSHAERANEANVGEGRKVLKQREARGLSAHEAKRVLEEIAPLLRDGVTVDLSYRIMDDD